VMLSERWYGKNQQSGQRYLNGFHRFLRMPAGGNSDALLPFCLGRVISNNIR
jgi:hypothetical protein